MKQRKVFCCALLECACRSFNNHVESSFGVLPSTPNVSYIHSEIFVANGKLKASAPNTLAKEVPPTLSVKAEMPKTKVKQPNCVVSDFWMAHLGSIEKSDAELLGFTKKNCERMEKAFQSRDIFCIHVERILLGSAIEKGLLYDECRTSLESQFLSEIKSLGGVKTSELRSQTNKNFYSLQSRNLRTTFLEFKTPDTFDQLSSASEIQIWQWKKELEEQSNLLRSMYQRSRELMFEMFDLKRLSITSSPDGTAKLERAYQWKDTELFVSTYFQIRHEIKTLFLLAQHDLAICAHLSDLIGKNFGEEIVNKWRRSQVFAEEIHTEIKNCLDQSFEIYTRLSQEAEETRKVQKRDTEILNSEFLDQKKEVIQETDSFAESETRNSCCVSDLYLVMSTAKSQEMSTTKSQEMWTTKSQEMTTTKSQEDSSNATLEKETNNEAPKVPHIVKSEEKPNSSPEKPETDEEQIIPAARTELSSTDTYEAPEVPDSEERSTTKPPEEFSTTKAPEKLSSSPSNYSFLASGLAAASLYLVHVARKSYMADISRSSNSGRHSRRSPSVWNKLRFSSLAGHCLFTQSDRLFRNFGGHANLCFL